MVNFKGATCSSREDVFKGEKSSLIDSLLFFYIHTVLKEPRG